MRNLNIKHLLFLLIFLLADKSFGQDMNYTQYFASPIYYNPAYTGLTSGFRARFLYREQWPQLPIDFKSYYFSADIGDRNLPGAGGIGLLVASDNPGIGLINNLTVGLNFSVRIRINSLVTSQLGIKAAMLQRSINTDDLIFTGQLDEKYGPIYQSSFNTLDANKKTVPDFAAGGIIQFSNPDGKVTGNAGISVDHLFKPDISFLMNQDSRIPRKWVIHTDVTIVAGAGGSSGISNTSRDPLRINIGAIYQNQNKLNAFQIGLNLIKYNLYFGAWYKNTLTSDSPNSALAILAGYRYTYAEDMSVKFIYSYDIQISGALQGTGGAHEISLVLDFDNFSLFGNSRGGYGPSNRRNGASYMECSDFY